MRDWTEHGNMKMSAMVAADHLHMTDASYDCLARQLSGSILRDTQIAADIARRERMISARVRVIEGRWRFWSPARPAFIGMHVSAALLERGEQVVGIDNLNDYYASR